MAIHTDEQKKLARKVIKRILDEPRRYDQTKYGKKVSKQVSPCGTVGCLAGWTDHEANRTDIAIDYEQIDVFAFGQGVLRRARKALGLTPREANVVFTANPDSDYGDDAWPEPFRTNYRKARTKKARAEVAAAYLRRIIRTGKVT